MELRTLGNSGIRVSPLGLGTVKIGRNQQVKYPESFSLPDDNAVRELLHLAKDLGINLIDTAPAYGSSQERLGRLLPGPRSDWVIMSKVGESFVNGQSHFDFSYEATIASVEDSLRTLNTDWLDVVLIHSNGDDLDILERSGAPAALQELKRRGWIRAHGMSSKTPEGGIKTVEQMDVVMATANPACHQDLPVLQRAQQLNKGVVIKKALMSGHIDGPEGVAAALRHVFGLPGVGSLIVGTINPAHLRQNAALLESVL